VLRPTPLTESTYDLYWIAVDKSKHRGGVGKRLLKFAEEEIVRRVADAAGGDIVAGDIRRTIQFYEKTGYDLWGRSRSITSRR